MMKKIWFVLLLQGTYIMSSDQAPFSKLYLAFNEAMRTSGKFNSSSSTYAIGDESKRIALLSSGAACLSQDFDFDTNKTDTAIILFHGFLKQKFTTVKEDDFSFPLGVQNCSIVCARLHGSKVYTVRIVDQTGKNRILRNRPS